MSPGMLWRAAEYMDKRLNDLDDVERLLSESPRTRPITRRKNEHRRRARRDKRLRDLRIERGIVTIPSVIIALICIVLIIEPFMGVKAELQEPTLEMPADESVMASEETQVEETEADTSIKPVDDEVLRSFFQRYFSARLAADVDTLDSMSGITNRTDEQKRALKEQLKVQAGYIEAYRNLEFYGARGLEENELLLLLSYDVKFRRADSLAPAIMYCYMLRAEDGGYQLVENRSPEQVRFVNSYINEHEEVQALISSVNSKLLETLSSDSRLAVLYDAFQTGRVYREDRSSIDSEVSLVTVETEASTAASTASANSRSSRSSTAASQQEAQQSEQVVEAADPGQEIEAQEQEAASDGTEPAAAPAGDFIVAEAPPA